MGKRVPYKDTKIQYIYVNIYIFLRKNPIFLGSNFCISLLQRFAKIGFCGVRVVDAIQKEGKC
jgi:hypothetical protein